MVDYVQTFNILSLNEKNKKNIDFYSDYSIIKSCICLFNLVIVLAAACTILIWYPVFLIIGRNCELFKWRVILLSQKKGNIITVREKTKNMSI